MSPSRYRLLLLGLIVLVAGVELFIAWLAVHPRVDRNYRAYYIDQTTTCLNKPVTGAYELGSTVSFMPDDQVGARHLRVCGWAGPGGDGTHSVGTSSRLRFAVGAVSGDLVLDMWVAAVTAPDGRDQHIVLRSAAGVPIGEATIPAGATRALEFNVPAAAIDRKQQRLDLIAGVEVVAHHLIDEAVEQDLPIIRHRDRKCRHDPHDLAGLRQFAQIGEGMRRRFTDGG